MSLSAADIQRVARLARLRIEDNEALHYAAQLSGVLGHFATMTTIDTTSITPLAHAIEIVAGSTRPDVVTEDDQRAGLQSGAPQVEAGYYLVPRVLE
jgi:aspartyl-tRNA(Asn)/glutamyl-tRNA(Gln) amidotransferase subunit C